MDESSDEVSGSLLDLSEGVGVGFLLVSPDGRELIGLCMLRQPERERSPRRSRKLPDGLPLPQQKIRQGDLCVLRHHTDSTKARNGREQAAPPSFRLRRWWSAGAEVALAVIEEDVHAVVPC